MLVLAIVSFVIWNLNIQTSFSSPIPKRTTDEDIVRWMSAPDTRGTFDLLLSCILTLILCMWTSLHLNVPPSGETTFRGVLRKLLWTMLALLAPEIIVFFAWSQWMSAKRICREINKILREKVCCL